MFGLQTRHMKILTFQVCRSFSAKLNTKEITVFIAIRFELKTYVYKPILFIIHSVIER